MRYIIALVALTGCLPTVDQACEPTFCNDASANCGYVCSDSDGTWYETRDGDAFDTKEEFDFFCERYATVGVYGHTVADEETKAAEGYCDTFYGLAQ